MEETLYAPFRQWRNEKIANNLARNKIISATNVTLIEPILIRRAKPRVVTLGDERPPTPERRVHKYVQRIGEGRGGERDAPKRYFGWGINLVRSFRAPVRSTVSESREKGGREPKKWPKRPISLNLRRAIIKKYQFPNKKKPFVLITFFINSTFFSF